MSTYNWPSSIEPSLQTFELVTNTRTFQSPINSAVQTSSRKGSYWKTTIELQNIKGGNRSWIQALLSRLNGQEHRLKIRDFGSIKRGEYVAGADTLLIDGAGQTGINLNIKGASASISNYFRVGAQIVFNQELHTIVANFNSDASGNLAVQVAPPIRKPTIDNDPVLFEVGDAFGTFIVTNNPAWRSQPGGFSSMTIEAIEDVLAGT